MLEYAFARKKGDLPFESAPPSSVESLVQQMLENEFNIKVKNEVDEDYCFNPALSLLKMANCICRWPHLFTESARILIEESDSSAIADDLDMTVALSRIHPSHFYHHKIDSYLLKSIQPYHDYIRQIAFQSCKKLEK